MTQDEVLKMAKQAGFSSAVGKHIALDDDLERFAKFIASAEREACAYWAGIALLGADRGLSNRVDQAIRARGQA